MALKRKTRKARKVVSAAPQEKKSQSKQAERTPEQLIRYNGMLVEEMVKTEVWQTIITELFDEMIASCSGRKTNGRYYHGSFTRGGENNRFEFLSGYQRGLMDLWNSVQDFIAAKAKQEEKSKEEAKHKVSKIVNPFLEDYDGSEDAQSFEV